MAKKSSSPTAAVSPSEDMMGEYHKYECEDALRTLTRAEEIKADPDLMEQVQKLASKQKKAISSIAALRGKREELAMEEDED